MSTAPTTPEVANVVIKELPAQDYLGQRFTAGLANVGRDVQAAYGRLFGRIKEAGSSVAGPPFLISSQPAGGVMEIEVCVPCSPVPEPAQGMHAGHLDPGRAATVLYRGPYDRMGKVYQQIFEWIERNGYSPAAAAREVYLNGPAEVQSPDGYLTDIIVPIR